MSVSVIGMIGHQGY